MQHFFTRENALGLLFIGQPAEDMVLIDGAKKVCSNFEREVCKQGAYDNFEKNRQKIILASYSFGDLYYGETLRKIKALDKSVELILLVSDSDCAFMREILDLKASKYLHIKSKKEDILGTITRLIEYLNNKERINEDMQYFDALLENSIVSKSDTEGNITYINENFTKVTGYTKDECLGKNHNILRHPSNPDEVYKDMWSTIKQGKIWRERVLNKNKDGSDFWAETTIIPYRDAKSNKIIEYIAIRRDITNMLQMKRKIHEQETKAQEQDKISEAKDSFLILFTHELKTPLNAIINFSKYLSKHVGADTIDKIPLSKRKHLLEQIHESAETMLGDVTNILDISRIKSHKLSYNLSSIDVRELILEVIKTHKALAIENKTEVSFVESACKPFITSDRIRLKQILANIISNAIKYSFGEVKIYLTCEENEIKIVVEDNGRGIKDKEAVFELFEQSGKGLIKKEKKGTGIGLSFVKLLCNDLDFKYKLEDSYDMGGLKFILSKSLKGN